ncbi:MAG: helix-turn-helix domain-containing protein [Nitrososphaerales archaeon]
MARDPLPEVISSRTRLKVADLISTRPRTLGELAAATGISIQGVLKHLKKLEELGLVEETSVRSPDLAVRKVYAAKGTRLGDFSTGDLTLVKLSGKPSAPVEEPDRPLDLEYLAEEAILQRRRVRDQARRLGRMIDDLVEDESRIKVALESMDLSDTERLILQVLFTEESLEEGERVLLEHFGLQDGKRSIEKALSKARHHIKKRIDR